MSAPSPFASKSGGRGGGHDPPAPMGAPPLRSQVRAKVDCYAASWQIHSVDELKRRLIDVWCGFEQSIFDEAIDQWRGWHRACVHAKGGHFEYSLWTDNVDFVHNVTFNVTCSTVIMKSCQQRCLFYNVVHYQIWGMMVDFRIHLVEVNFCLQQWKNNKIGQYLQKLCSNEKGSSFYDSRCMDTNTKN